MIETRARVVETGPGIALVEAERAAGCGHCSSEKGCGKSSMSRLFFSKPSRFEVIDPLGKKVGDEVWIGVQDGALLRSSVAVYVVPMSTFLIGAGLGNAVGGDAFSALGGAIGLMVGFFFSRRYNASKRGNTRFQPYILR